MNVQACARAAPGETVTVRPRSSEVLFYPSTVTAAVAEHDACAPPLATILARRGVYWTGHIQPAIADARIFATAGDQVLPCGGGACLLLPADTGLAADAGSGAGGVRRGRGIQDWPAVRRRLIR